MAKYPVEYDDWKADPSAKNLSRVMGQYKRLVSQQMGLYKGTIADNILKSYAKVYLAKAIKNYNPEKGALSTHIVNNLKQLNRLNYSSQQALRMSEALQQKVGRFIEAEQKLVENLEREPTLEELSENLGWDLSRVKRMKNQVRKEISTGLLEFDPGVLGSDNFKEYMDYVYHDLDTKDKYIFEKTTGYGGSPTTSKVDIAKKLKISPGLVSNRSLAIANKLKEGLQNSDKFKRGTEQLQ